MRIFLSFILLTASILVACRKEELRTLPSDYKAYTSDCTNGLQDGDETGIDCGGSCTPCVTVDLDCGIEEGQFRFGDVELSLGNSNILNNGFTVSSSLGQFIFQFQGLPFTTGIFQCTDYNSNYSGNKCGILFNVLDENSEFTEYKSFASGDNIQVTVDATGYTIKFCDVQLKQIIGDIQNLDFFITIPF